MLELTTELTEENFKTDQDKASFKRGDIIGILQGDFLPSNANINDIYISIDLWKLFLKKPAIQEQLKNRLLFGITGPDEINENSIREGNICFVLTGVQYIENNLLCEANILNTPGGINLIQLIKAGVNLQIKPNCSLKLKNYRGKLIPDFETFKLNGFNIIPW